MAGGLAAAMAVLVVVAGGAAAASRAPATTPPVAPSAGAAAAVETPTTHPLPGVINAAAAAGSEQADVYAIVDPVRRPGAVLRSQGATLTDAEATEPGARKLVPVAGGIMSLPADMTYASDRVLVRFRPGTPATAKSAVRGSVGGTTDRAYRLVPGLELLRLPEGKGPLDAVAALSRNPNVEYAVLDVAMKLQAVPNDPLFASQWGPGAIGAPNAWGRVTGSASVKVAVLDSGIAQAHPDLAGNLWTNPGENCGSLVRTIACAQRTDGVDNDANGYVDDVHGWDFVNSDSSPEDDNGHGTHVAGIIGAVGNNSVGVAGVNWAVSVMPLKICDSNGACYGSAELAALDYAVAHGVRVANASFGGAYGEWQPERDAIQAAGTAGLLFVAAAGNNAANNDQTAFYPASYPLDNIISVAAMTSSETLASFSNYGSSTVDIGAPGADILSTLPTTGPLSSASGYGSLNGTSMAAPQVAGAAALLRAQHPDWTMQQLRDRLLGTTRESSTLAGKTATCGTLDVGAATDPSTAAALRVCVSVKGTGQGVVTSSPYGISCGSGCLATFPAGTSVALTAEPVAGSTFAGWAGACSGTGSCTVSTGNLGAVTATFRASRTDGWLETPLAPPAGRDPLPAGTLADGSFFNVSVSADGNTRAKTIYNRPAGGCYYDSSDTGGVYLERRTEAGWVADGALTAPVVGSSSTQYQARWTNCFDFGSVTKLSRDGSTLLVSQPGPTWVWTATNTFAYRWCAAFVYRRGTSGWALDGTLFPPGAPDGLATTPDGCPEAFGLGGAISDDGTRVALNGFDHAQVYARGSSGWALEQDIVLPTGVECGVFLARNGIVMSGLGAQLLVSDSSCKVDGIQRQGLVHAYERTGSVWTLAQTIKPPQPQFQSYLGESMAISADGSTATIAIIRADDQPLFAGAAWVFARDVTGWAAKLRLSSPLPEERTTFTCPSVLANGQRIVCHAYDTVGHNAYQGSIYLLDRPGISWTSSPSLLRVAAVGGLDYDWMGASIGAPDDGRYIDAVISTTNIANGSYAHDRIGYEFVSPDAPRPSITSFTPTSGGAGAAVRITGANLTGATAVAFNTTPAASFTVDSPTQITAVFPDLPEAGPISVTTPGGTVMSTAIFSGPPAISSFSPTAAGTFSRVTIKGRGFLGTTAVRFNGVSTPYFSVVSGTEITATVWFDTSAGPISVTTPGGTATSTANFTIAPPVITSVSPSSGTVGTSVTISGTNLGGVTGVAFNGTSALGNGYSNSATYVVVKVPDGASSGPVSVTTAGGTATSGSSFTVVSAPSISSFTPASGPVGTSVQVTGTNLTGATSVKFNGTSATSYTVNSATQVTATVPAGATTGAVSVTTPGGTATSGSTFTVIAAPTISSISPTSGLVGASVTVTGSNLLGASAVRFNGRAAVFTVLSATSIVTSVPVGASSGPISVTTSGGTASSVSFTVKSGVVLPSVTGYSPPVVRPGSAVDVTLTGTNLGGVTAASLNGVALSGITVLGVSSVRVSVPGSGVASGPIRVTTAGGTSTNTNVFGVNAAPQAIDAGVSHTCAVLAGGSARCWGLNSNGRLGDGTTTQRTSPVEVLSAAATRLTGVSAVSAGGSSTCALLSSGAIRCWGNNTNGQLGTGSTTSLSYASAAVSGISTATQVSVGTSHACARLSDGTARCWGLNTNGRLGDGTTTQRTSPVTVLSGAGTNLTGVVAVSAGDTSTCALLTSGAIRCFGLNTNGQLGTGNTTALSYASTAVIGISTATQVSVGTSYACAVLSGGASGTAKCWGLNSSGRLGDGTTTQRLSPVTVLSAASTSLTGVSEIAAGANHTCALLGSGGTSSVRCFGLNTNGQLGTGSTTSLSYVSASVSGATGTSGLTRGTSYTAALVPSTSLPPTGGAAWGLNSSGQLGDGTTTQRTSPTTLTGL